MHEKKKNDLGISRIMEMGQPSFPYVVGICRLFSADRRLISARKGRILSFSVFIQLQRYNLRLLCYRLRHEASLIVMIQNNISDNCSSDGVAWEMERCIFHFLNGLFVTVKLWATPALGQSCSTGGRCLSAADIRSLLNFLPSGRVENDLIIAWVCIFKNGAAKMEWQWWDERS